MKLRAGSIPAEAYHEDVRVRSYEVGREGSVRPATLLRYLEHLATDASSEAGFEPNWYLREGTAWVVRTMDLSVGPLPHFGEHLRVATWVAEYRRVQAIRDYAIWNVATGALVARAEARWAYIDRARGVPVRLPEAMTAGMQVCGHLMVKRTPTASLADMDESRFTFDRTAHEYEVDSQQHINNCAYVDWLWEAAQQALGNVHRPGSAAFQPRYYAIEYIKPTFPGERIQVVTRLRPSVANQLQVEQEMAHAAGGGVCVRATTTYLRPRSPVREL